MILNSILDKLLVIGCFMTAAATIQTVTEIFTTNKIVNRVLKSISQNDLSPPLYMWMIAIKSTFLLAWNVLLPISLADMIETIMLVLFVFGIIFYSIGNIFGALIVGISVKAIVNQSKSCMNNTETLQLVEIYTTLVDTLGPHLLIALSISTIRLILATSGAVTLLSCKNPYTLMAITYFVITFYDVFILLFYCFSMHKCQKEFKDVANRFRYEFIKLNTSLIHLNLGIFDI